MNLLSRFSPTDMPSVDVTAAHQRAGDVILLDVREADEWADGHAPEARHHALSAFDPASLPSGQPIYVICRSGNRSARATTALRQTGIDAYNVEGGMIAWADAGLPIVR